MKRVLFALALLLPLIGLGTSIATRQSPLADATQWDIPITGYDPRDPLRGRYIAFTYAWDVRGDPGTCKDAACALCLSREGVAIIATMQPPETACPARVDLAASAIDVRPSFRDDNSPPSFASRIFVSETSAPELETMLREQPMQVLAMLTKDGRLVNRRIKAVR